MANKLRNVNLDYLKFECANTPIKLAPNVYNTLNVLADEKHMPVKDVPTLLMFAYRGDDYALAYLLTDISAYTAKFVFDYGWLCNQPTVNVDSVLELEGVMGKTQDEKLILTNIRVNLPVDVVKWYREINNSFQVALMYVYNNVMLYGDKPAYDESKYVKPYISATGDTPAGKHAIQFTKEVHEKLLLKVRQYAGEDTLKSFLLNQIDKLGKDVASVYAMNQLLQQYIVQTVESAQEKRNTLCMKNGIEHVGNNIYYSYETGSYYLYNFDLQQFESFDLLNQLDYTQYSINDVLTGTPKEILK